MVQDLRYAWRSLLRAKPFAITACAVLALGIGAATAVFSIVNGALLRPLPYRDPGRLVEILDQSLRERGMNKLFATYADFREYARHSRTLEDVAAVTWAVKSPILTGRGPARTVTAISVSADFFRLLGASAALGRTFLPADESGGCAVVLSHAFWASTFGANRRAVGESIALDGAACAVIGVMPSGFAFYPAAAEMWKLISPATQGAGKTLVIGVARLKNGVTPAQAQTELSALFRGLHANDEWRDFGPAVNPLQGEFVWLAGRGLRATLWVLLAAVALVLAIACVNVANLLLGRHAVRSREFALRAALGGGRARLFRQLLAEGAVISAFGGAGGIWLAYGALRYFAWANPVELPACARLAIDPRVILFALAICSLTALVFALTPALGAARADLSSLLRSGGRGTLAGGARLGRLVAALETRAFRRPSDGRRIIDAERASHE